ncbi:MAG: YkgJ family cysteine cluster protein [Fibrobacterota bacterium]
MKQAGEIYKSGIRFKCLKCGVCCLVKDSDYGVYLYKDDILRMSEFLSITPEKFVLKYALLAEDVFIFSDMEISSKRVQLRIKNARCIFSDGKLCSVYGARPFICRKGPFIRGFMEFPANWKNFKKICGGIGKGERQSAEKIRRVMAEEDRKERKYFEKDIYGEFFNDLFKQKRSVKTILKYSCTYDEYLDSPDPEKYRSRNTA